MEKGIYFIISILFFVGGGICVYFGSTHTITKTTFWPGGSSINKYHPWSIPPSLYQNTYHSPLIWLIIIGGILIFIGVLLLIVAIFKKSK